MSFFSNISSFVEANAAKVKAAAVEFEKGFDPQAHASEFLAKASNAVSSMESDMSGGSMDPLLAMGFSGGFERGKETSPAPPASSSHGSEPQQAASTLASAASLLPSLPATFSLPFSLPSAGTAPDAAPAAPAKKGDDWFGMWGPAAEPPKTAAPMPPPKPTALLPPSVALASSLQAAALTPTAPAKAIPSPSAAPAPVPAPAPAPAPTQPVMVAPAAAAVPAVDAAVSVAPSTPPEASTPAAEPAPPSPAPAAAAASASKPGKMSKSAKAKAKKAGKQNGASDPNLAEDDTPEPTHESLQPAAIPVSLSLDAASPSTPTASSAAPDATVEASLRAEVARLAAALHAKEEALAAVREGHRAESAVAAHRLTELHRALTSLKEELAVAQESHRSAEGRCGAWEGRARELEAAVQSGAEDRAALQATLREAHASLEGLERERRALQREVAQFKSQLAQQDVSVRSTMERQQEAASKREEEMRARAEGAEAEAAALRASLQELEHRSRELAAERDHFQGQSALLERSVGGVEGRVADLEAELQAAAERCASLERDLAAGDERLQRMEQEARQRSSKFAHLQGEFKRREEGLAARIAELEAQVGAADPAELLAAKARLESLESELSAAAAARDAAVAEARESRAVLAEVEGERDELAARLAALDEEFARERTEREELMGSLEASSQRGEEEVSGLIERAIAHRTAELGDKLSALASQLRDAQELVVAKTKLAEDLEYRAQAAEVAKIDLTLKLARLGERLEILEGTGGRRASVEGARTPEGAGAAAEAASTSSYLVSDGAGPLSASDATEVRSKLVQLEKRNNELTWQIKLLTTGSSGGVPGPGFEGDGSNGAGGQPAFMNYIVGCMAPRR